MAIIKKKIENLKPGRDYLISVRTKNPDLNVYSESSNSILVSIPKDTTIPDAISSLSLYASFQNVMFVFNFSNDLDIDKYEYELYNNGAGTGTPTSAGFNTANVFTVAVPNSTDTVAKSYWGRVRSVDTTGNLGPWTSLIQTDQSTPLIDNQYISNLTASKITAGTIGAQTITLAGVNSILRSNNYTPATANTGGLGWKISGDGKAVFNDASIRSSLDIGEDQGTSDATSFHVDSNGNMWSGSNSTSFSTAPFRVTNTGGITASSLTLTGLTELATGSKIFLGDGNYNDANTAFYVDATEQFSLGNKLTWNGNTLTVQGTLKLSDGTDVLDAEDVGNIAEGLVDEFGDTIYEDGFIGGLTISANTMYYGTGSFASGSTAFFVGQNPGGQANFSLGDKLTWDGTTLSITGNVVITGGTTLDDINDAKDAADDAKDAADEAQSDADAAYAYADAAFDNANNKITIGGAGISVDNDGKLTQISGDVIRTGLIASPGNTSYIDLNNGTFNFGNGAIEWTGAALNLTGTLNNGGFVAASDGTVTSSSTITSSGTIFALNMQVYGSDLTYRAKDPPASAGDYAARWQQISDGLQGGNVWRITINSSRREVKDNIEDISNALEKIKKLKPRTFTFNDKFYEPLDPSTGEAWTQEHKDLRGLAINHGFIVEEVEEVDPRLVSYGVLDPTCPSDQPGGLYDLASLKPLMWKDQDMIALLTKAVQELSAKVEELESRLS